MKKPLIFLLLIPLLLTGCGSSTENPKETEKNQEEIIVEDLENDEVVIIEDSELRRFILDQVGKTENDDILFQDMQSLYWVNINYEDYAVTNIKGLEYAKEMTSFSYRNGGTLDSLDPISNNPILEHVLVSYSDVENTENDFNPPLLERFMFTDTNVTDFSFISKATKIYDLSISTNNVEDISFMENFTELTTLNLSYNNITDISALSNKTKLQTISLHKNNVNNIEPLGSCTNLETINISYNNVNNIEWLLDLEKLYELTAYEELDAKIIPRTQIDTLIETGVSVLYHE